MALSDIAKRLLGSNVGTVAPRSAPVPTEAHQPAPVDTSAHRSGPMAPVLGSVRWPREHAVALVEALVAEGLAGRSIYVGDLEEAHHVVCERLGWQPTRWPAIGRELRKLGLQKVKVDIDGERLTYYEIQPVKVADVV